MVTVGVVARRCLFRCDSVAPFLFAGRDGFVTDVQVQKQWNLDGFGQIAVAEFSLAVTVQHQQSVKVALVNVTPGGRCKDNPAWRWEDWTTVVDALSRKTVRFVAGGFEDKLDQFLVAMAALLQVRCCSTVQFHADGDSLEASAMCILGPVGEVQTLSKEEGGGHTLTRGDGEVAPELTALINVVDSIQRQPPYGGHDGSDRSRHWTKIQHAKEKAPQHVEPHTKKIVVYFGSKNSRRKGGAFQTRQDSRGGGGWRR